MLGKILKYDLKNIGRQIAPAYVLLFLLSIFVNLVERIHNHYPENMAVKLLSGSSSAVFYGGMVMTCVVLLVISLQYYKKNLLQDEGYLMHTLPVTAGSLIISKMLATIIWSVITLLACYIYQAIVSNSLLWGKNVINTLFLGMEKADLGEEKWLFIFVIFVVVVTFCISMLSGIFMAYNIGYSFQGKFRSVLVLLICIVVYFINQITALGIELVSIYTKYRSWGVLDTSGGLSVMFIEKMFLLCSIVYLICGGIYSVVAVYQMNKHLNLD